MKSGMTREEQAINTMQFKEMVKRVSRSLSITFYLLPKYLQDPVIVAYLIAKLGDSIVDAYGEVSLNRLKAYEALQRCFAKTVCNGEIGVDTVIKTVKYETEEEAYLANHFHIVLKHFVRLPSDQRGYVENVVLSIFKKQREELDAIVNEGFYKLNTYCALESYVYQMSGVVGEFWTEIGMDDRHYSKLDKSSLLQLGREYGNSLHYINILRDMNQDCANQRFYIPSDESTKEKMYESAQSLLSQIEAGLRSGLEYTKSLRSYKLRIGMSLPARIGLLYLSRMQGLSWEEFQSKKIIKRKDVHKLLLKSIFRF